MIKKMFWLDKAKTYPTNYHKEKKQKQNKWPPQAIDNLDRLSSAQMCLKSESNVEFEVE